MNFLLLWSAGEDFGPTRRTTEFFVCSRKLTRYAVISDYHKQTACLRFIGFPAQSTGRQSSETHGLTAPEPPSRVAGYQTQDRSAHLSKVEERRWWRRKEKLDFCRRMCHGFHPLCTYLCTRNIPCWTMRVPHCKALVERIKALGTTPSCAMTGRGRDVSAGISTSIPPGRMQASSASSAARSTSAATGWTVAEPRSREYQRRLILLRETSTAIRT